VAAFPGGLVWLASYPKSGNTWMRILLANLLSARDEPADINNLSEPQTLMGRWRFADDMLVDPDLLDSRELGVMRPIHCDFAAQDLSHPFFCKTHDQFWSPEGELTLGASARRVLYIIRDPRDVAISFSYHAGLSIDDTITQMVDRNASSTGRAVLPCFMGDWGTHVVGWASQPLIPVMVVRYESMHANTVSCLRSIVDFLGGQADEMEIRRAVAHGSFDELQRQEARKGFREARPGQERFFRTGQAGGWREVLKPHQLRRIEDHFADIMTAYGYEIADRSQAD
jgi:hypothetical protein